MLKKLLAVVVVLMMAAFTAAPAFAQVNLETGWTGGIFEDPTLCPEFAQSIDVWNIWVMVDPWIAENCTPPAGA